MQATFTGAWRKTKAPNGCVECVERTIQVVEIYARDYYGKGEKEYARGYSQIEVQYGDETRIGPKHNDWDDGNPERVAAWKEKVLAQQANNAPICSACNGSGEGMADGTRCRECNGRGTERPYGRIDPNDPLTSSDVKRAGIKPSPAPLTPSQVEAAYAAKAAARAARLARVHQQPVRIDNSFERVEVRAGGNRSVFD